MKNKKTYLILLIALVIIAVFGLKVIFNNNSGSSQEIIQTEQISIGDDDIKVTFLELGSVGCIPCDQMQPILKEIAEEFKGQVRVVFHDVNTLPGRPYIQEYGIRAIPPRFFLIKTARNISGTWDFYPKKKSSKCSNSRE